MMSMMRKIGLAAVIIALVLSRFVADGHAAMALDALSVLLAIVAIFAPERKPRA